MYYYQNESQIARFMRPTWGPSGADRTQVGSILAPWTLLSGISCKISASCFDYNDFLIPTAGMTAINARRISFNCQNNVIFICLFLFLYKRNSLKKIKHNFVIYIISHTMSDQFCFARQIPKKTTDQMSYAIELVLNHLRLEYIVHTCIRWFLARYYYSPLI